MRAIGYIKCRDRDGETPNAQNVKEWLDSVGSTAVAGSWGQTSDIESRLRTSTSDPVSQIIEFCRAGGHHLTTILGLRMDDSLLQGVEAELSESLGIAFMPRVTDDFGDSQFAELIERLEGRHGRPALVVIPDSSHLAPDLETLVERLLYIRRSGSDVICTDFEMPDPLQNGEELLGLRGEPDWLRKRIRSAIREKASRGKVLGRTPYGYRCGSDGMLKPVPEEARVIRQIYEWYVGDGEASGDDSEKTGDGVGMRLIAQRLASENILTRTGKPWSTAAVSIILKNRVYVGTYTRYGFLVSGNHEPIIKRSLFRRAQDKLMVKQRQRRLSKSEDPFLLGGLLTCGQCGHGVPGLTRRRTWSRQDHTTATKSYRYYEYYECQQRRSAKNGDDNGIRCPKWRADDLDSKVRKAVMEWEPDMVKRIRPRETRVSMSDQLQNAERAFLNEARIVSTGRGDLEDLAPFLADIKKLRGLLGEEDLNNVDAESSTHGRVLRERMTQDLIADVLGSQDVERARKALAALVDDVIVTEDGVTILPRMAV